MATVNAIPESKQNPSAMGGLIRYCLSKEKTFDSNCGRKLVTGINCVAENSYTEFMTTKAVYNQERGVYFYHYDQSFSPKENVTPEQVHEIGIEFAKRAWPQQEVLVTTHLDADHLHSHFVVNSVKFESGLKMHVGPNTIKTLRDLSDEICISHGLSVLKPYQKGGRSISRREYYAAMKGESWKFRLANEISRVMKIAGDRETFVKEMAKRGYQMKWTDERRNITFSCPNGKLCRDIKLHDNKFLKEMIENEFKIREQLRREFLDGRIDEKELFEFSRVRATELSREGVRTVGETEVDRDRTDEGYGKLSAETVQADIRAGNEQRYNTESDSIDESVIDRIGQDLPENATVDNGIGSANGGSFETGWETERRIYFEILLRGEGQSESTRNSYRSPEEQHTEIYVDTNRNLSGVLAGGVGTLTALASLMDNDQDDDPEEKKKKLDAKDAGSNIGFALGGAIGLAAALIAKGKKQDEDITETPTEEPDEVEEINNEPYEESEDLDEDEGFKLEM